MRIAVFCWLILPLSLMGQSKFNQFKAQKYVLDGARKLYRSQYEASIQDFQFASQLDPYNADVYQFRAEAYYRLGDYQLALDDFDRAINQQNGSAELFYRRGLTNEQLQNYRYAMFDYEDALDRDPNHGEALTAYRRIRQKMGRDPDFPPTTNPGPYPDPYPGPNPRPTTGTGPDPVNPGEPADPWVLFEEKARSWERYEPSDIFIGGSPNDDVSIDGVYLTPSSTFIKMTVRNTNRFSNKSFKLEWPRTNESFYLTDKFFKKSFSLIDVYNGKFGKITIPPSGSITFALEFERLEGSLLEFHLRQGKNPPKDAWNFYNIVLNKY